MGAGENSATARIVDGRHEDGFTLIELLTVMVVLGILLAVAIPAFLGQRERAADAVASSSVRVATVAIEAYHQDHDTYTGMTSSGLRSAYDRALPAGLVLAGLTDSTYCAELTYQGQTWSKAGPGGTVVESSC